MNLSKNNLKILVTLAIIIVSAVVKFSSKNEIAQPAKNESTTNSNSVNNSEILKSISEKKESKFIEVQNAKVTQLLRDDNRGIRHQKWLVQINPETTIMVVYNLDLAERVPLSVGDTVNIGGELEFDDRTGKPLMHWTHEDPRHKRRVGYVQLNGKKYGKLAH